MKRQIRTLYCCAWVLALAGGVGLAGQQSQAATAAPPAPVSGFSLHQTTELGGRDSQISGNLNNYDTFENLQSGLRLFNFNLMMQALDHNEPLLDTLSFANSGYGGDPNDVSRLRISKAKVYDFRAVFRRDVDFWDYNLLANPLNPASSNPAVAIASSPHSLDRTRMMQGYDLTLFPDSRVRFRLGFGHNVDEGPGFTTVEGGTEPLLAENFHYTTNDYRMGVDYRLTPKTTLSFDELLSYFKQDNTITDQSFGYVLTNGTPADLGIVFNTKGGSPCAAPVANPGTNPPTANPNCNGYLAYSRVGRPRGSFPTERFSFQSSDIAHLTMDGSASYSSDRNSTTDYLEAINGWTTRTLSRGSNTSGPANAARVAARADWSGDYQLNAKLDIFDAFHYDNWREPSLWDTAQVNLFGTKPPAAGQTGLLLPISPVNPGNFASLCPAPFNGPQCPQHNASSPADVVSQFVSQFLAQKLTSDELEIRYQLNPRLTTRIGYAYTARTIADYSATFETGDIFFPGGATASAANLFLAARGDCALASGVLPDGCSQNADGSITEGSPSNPLPDGGNDSSRNLYLIHEHDLLLGADARPGNDLRLYSDFLFGYRDNAFTRISPRQVQEYKVRGTYSPRSWLTVNGAVDIAQNRDNVYTVNHLEHDRNYGGGITLAPGGDFYFDFGYNEFNVYTQADICFAASPTAFTTPCPVVGATGPLGALAFYSNKDHYTYSDVMWKPQKRVTASFGYAGSIARGTTLFLNPLQPTGPLDFNYLRPSARLKVDLAQGIAGIFAWNYYQYHDEGIANPVGLAPLPLQNFNGSNFTLSVQYAF
ncbi:MAG: hypothetical protein EPN33_07470 [Acidobacteria bacterium]|nr:MAG: hypothetical protein EPN33_07470 [Acidobacteriota bacterium]